MSDQTEFAKVLSAGGVLPPDDTGRRTKPEQTTGPKRHKAADRFAMLNAFIDFTAGDLDRAELVVWLILYRDARDGVSRTSQADLARRAGCDERTVRRAIKQLRDHGLLRVVRQGGVNRGPSAYRLRPTEDGADKPSSTHKAPRKLPDTGVQ